MKKSFKKNYQVSFPDFPYSLIVKDLAEAGIKGKDISKVFITLDWGACFYEGDEPELKVEYKP